MKKGAKTHIPVRLPGKNFWLILLDYVFVPALLYLMTANWCVELFPATPRWMWVIVFVGINTLINVRGITYTARADWIMFYVEAVVLALFIGFGLNYVLGEGGGTGQLVMDPLYLSLIHI